MGVKIKHQDPSINELATNDLVVNVEQGSLFFRSYEKLYKLQGDDLSTSVTESGGSIGMWTRSNNDLYYTAGDVGIGTTTPSTRLEVFDTTAPQFTIKYDSTHYMTLSNQGFFDLEDGGSTNNVFKFTRDSTEQMRIDPNGNVGIGTGSPQHDLHIKSRGTDNADGAIIKLASKSNHKLGGYIQTNWYSGDYNFIHLGSSYYDGSNWITNEEAQWGSNHRLQLVLKSAGFYFVGSASTGNTAISEDTATFLGHTKMFIEDTGNVGMGTTSPTALLHLGANGSAAANTDPEEKRLAIHPPAHTGGPFYFVARDDAAAANLDIHYNTVHKTTINSDGNLGIGTKNPHEKIHIGGDGVGMRIGASDEDASNNVSFIHFAENVDGSDDMNYGGEIKFDGAASVGGYFIIGVRDGTTTTTPTIRIDRRSNPSGSVTTPCLNFDGDGYLNVYTILRTRNRDVHANNHNKHQSGMYMDTRNTSGMPGQFDALNGGTDGNPLSTTAADGSVHRNLIYLYASTGSSDPGRICHETSGVIVSGGTDFRNRSTLHLCPGDDNSSLDYVSVHGSNDAENIIIYTDGNIDYSGTLTDTSDRRIKKNINPLSGSLDKILKLKGVSFNWKDEKKGKEQLHGLIAQEVREVIPEIVREMNKKVSKYNTDIPPEEYDDPLLGITYLDLVPFLIESIKDQQKQIDELKEKLNG